MNSDHYYIYMSSKSNPEMFKGLEKEDFDLLSDNFWNRLGDVDRRLCFKQNFSWQYGLGGENEFDFLKDRINPTQREKRWMYKKHVGLYMSDYDYPK